VSVLQPIFTALMALISLGAAGFGLVGVAWTIVDALEQDRE
jgi:hypothetical protein